MVRRANGPALLALLVLFAGAACKGAPEQAPPTKLSEEKTLVDPPKRPEGHRKFDDPDIDPPPEREGQIPPEDIEAALAQAKAQVAAGKPQHAIPTLHQCANKTPPSARCDGELGIVLAELGKAKAHMRYFLAEAASTDDPKADADLYRRVAAAARKRGQHPTRAQAMKILIDRGVATADDLAERARALAADSTRIADAIEALRLAVEKDPTRHDLHLERGVLLAQTQAWAESEQALQEYLRIAPADDKQRALAEQRLAVIRQQLGGQPPPDPQ